MLITFDNLVNLAKNDCQQMEFAGKNLGVNFNLPQLEKVHNKYEEQLLIELGKINYNDGKQVAIVVLDRGTKHLYPVIKNYLYTQGGLCYMTKIQKEEEKNKI